MKNSNLAVRAAITSELALGGAVLTSAYAEAAAKEKYYGVSKTGQNDCAIKTRSCAGPFSLDMSFEDAI